jgi:nitroimidazol reductase NimA-like FMN-containing flavoprotein (pyridoxamine 5'-phosphate oxidase superfamily)
MAEDKTAILAKNWVKTILAEKGVAKLGTANPKNNQPHVTPVWFEWDGESLYISAFISTRKARDVEKNPRISVLIEDHTPGKAARAVLMEGQAELIATPGEVQKYSISVYTKYLGAEGIKEQGPASWVVDPENRIIKLTPEKVFAWGDEN